MAIIEEIQQMKSTGVSDQEILQNLQSRGISAQQAYEAMQQATIKDAVVQEPSAPSQDMQALQPSVMESPQDAQQYTQDQYAQYPQQTDQGQYYQDYSQPSISTDTISEIAEQILNEKIMSLRESIENIAVFKTSADAKLSALDERLIRIEKIIDRLQLSILQKVGETMTNIEDLKKEVIETQKTFKAQQNSPRQFQSPQQSRKPSQQPQSEDF